MRNPPSPHPQHRAWFPLREARPAIVHFLGHHVSSWLYKREAVRMRLANDFGAAGFRSQCGRFLVSAAVQSDG